MPNLRYPGTSPAPFGIKKLRARHDATPTHQLAIIDVETTGFSGADRILEIGIAFADAHGTVLDQWHTLVNADRDFSNSDIHGIYPQDIRHAPRFTEAYSTLLALLDGKILVAHNAGFDTRMLVQELTRAGVAGAYMDGLCTMKLLRRYWPGVRTRLSTALDYFGLSNAREHSAMGDALATAQLLAAMLRNEPRITAEINAVRPLSFVGHAVDPSLRLTPRPERSATPGVLNDSWLNELAEEISQAEDAGAARGYIELLDHAMIDCYLSSAEQDDLAAEARRAGLSTHQIREIHLNYVRRLALLAMADRIVTPEEQRQLTQAAVVLGISPKIIDSLLVEAQQQLDGCDKEANPATEQQPAPTLLQLQPGDRVTFTGATAVPRTVWEQRASDAGLDVGGVIKRSTLLVAANPDSLSGKAKKARNLGVPIVTEECFAGLLAAMTA